MHLILYDDKCALCRTFVCFVLKADRAGEFRLAPLQGRLARTFHGDAPAADSMVLIENWGQDNQRRLLRGKGAMRVLWLLKGKWRLIGIFAFLPAPFLDGPYRCIARLRYRLFKREVQLPSDARLLS